MLRGVLYSSSSLGGVAEGESGMRRQIPALRRPLARGRDGCAATVRDGREARAKQWTCKEGGLLQLDGAGGGRSWGVICRIGASDPSLERW